MWPPLTIGVVFAKTPIYYRYYTPTHSHTKKPCTFLLLFTYLSTVGKFPWLEFFPLILAVNTLFSSHFPDWESFQKFPWSVGTLLNWVHDVLCQHLAEGEGEGTDLSAWCAAPAPWQGRCARWESGPTRATVDSAAARSRTVRTSDFRPLGCSNTAARNYNDKITK